MNDPITLIQRYEEMFIEAAKLAKRLRPEAVSRNKTETGNPHADIVTSADLEVQEYVLSRLADTSLAECELVAEEKTESTGRFAAKADWVLTLDPIDGTMAYANGWPMYATVVGIHDKRRPLYTFAYYPEVEWGFRIVGDTVELIGTAPSFPEVKVVPKTVSYSKDPRHFAEPYRILAEEGYVFRTRDEVSPEIGAAAQFVLGLTDGAYYENGSAVDVLMALHYGIATGCRIWQDLDLSAPMPRINPEEPSRYAGMYVVAR